MVVCQGEEVAISEAERWNQQLAAYAIAVVLRHWKLDLIERSNKAKFLSGYSAFSIISLTDHF